MSCATHEASENALLTGHCRQRHGAAWFYQHRRGVEGGRSRNGGFRRPQGQARPEAASLSGGNLQKFSSAVNPRNPPSL